MKIEIDGKTINENKSVNYLGILIDCHFNWKEHIQQLSKKKYRGIGILCKIMHYVNTLTQFEFWCQLNSDLTRSVDYEKYSGRQIW